MNYEHDTPMNNQEHKYWGKLASTSMNYVDYLTNSYDMVLKVVPDTRDHEEKALKSLVPAYYSPSERKIFIDASTAFDGMEKFLFNREVDISRRSHRDMFPLFSGMLAHEIGHEKYTRYIFNNTNSMGEVVTPMERKIVEILEESRMESRLLSEHSDPACYLAYSAHHVILKPLLEKFVRGEFERSEALSMLLLLNVRHALGIIPSSFIPSMMEGKIGELLGYEAVKQVTTILQYRLPYVEDNDYDEMVKISRFVIKHLELEDETPETPCHSHQNQSSEPEKGSVGDSSQNNSKPDTGDFMPSQDGDDESSESDIVDGISGNESTPIESKPALSDVEQKEFEKTLDEAGKYLDDHKEKVRTDNFDDDESEDEVTEKEINDHLSSISLTNIKNGGNMPSMSVISPTNLDRMNAQMLYQDIRRAQFRADTVTAMPTNKPQGKLVMRQAVKRGVQRSLDMEVTAKPWNRNSYEFNDNPPLIMGVAMDVSPSLKEYVPTFLHYMWSLNEAILMNEGIVKNALWSTPHVIVEHDRQNVLIPKTKLGGASDGLPDALRKLALECDFHHSMGAKILFIVTDSELPNPDNINEQLRIIKSLNVKIIWVSTTEHDYEEYKKYAHYVHISNPNKFYDILSPEVVRALEISE